VILAGIGRPAINATAILPRQPALEQPRSLSIDHRRIVSTLIACVTTQHSATSGEHADVIADARPELPAIAGRRRSRSRIDAARIALSLHAQSAVNERT
jgi:hypothetical protein